MVRTDDEINGVIDAANDAINEHGSKFPGMSFEDGVKHALEWVTGETDENPMEE
jgi:hypothetical protein